MALVQTKDPRVVRDTDTRALLSTNTEELLRHRRSRANVKKMMTQQQSLNDRFNAINGRLDRCEILLHELAQHISMLLSKYQVPPSERD